jgi:cobalt/nickel transport system ATP-binding protein
VRAPYALELCPRTLILNDGTIAAHGPTLELPSPDDALMAVNRLELPVAFDVGRFVQDVAPGC